MYLFQPVYAVLFALLFQWGVAVQDLRLGRVFIGRITLRKLAQEAAPTLRKSRRQLIKDYLVFPLLALPFGANALAVLAGNVLANLLRNLWTFLVIFCGHFTERAAVFSKESVAGESRGHWYLRQLRGSSNLEGGRLFHILTGNLSHQIEHHLFPDIPARRYADMAPRVREICATYGVPYNTGSLPRQLLTVAWRIVRHSFPGGRADLSSLGEPATPLRS